MNIAKVTSKGQITIPASVRREFGIFEGTDMRFFNENGRLYLEKNNERTEKEKKLYSKVFAEVLMKSGQNRLTNNVKEFSRIKNLVIEI